MHGGNIRELSEKMSVRDEEILDFSANINPLGFPSWIRSVVNRTLEGIQHYPDLEQIELREAAAKHFSLPIEEIIAGNGASELISLLPSVLNPDQVIIPVPAYTEYDKACRGKKIIHFHLQEKDNFSFDTSRFLEELRNHRGRSLIFLGQPGNPTGNTILKRNMIQLAEDNPSAWFCIDESFADFLPDYTTLGTAKNSNIIIIRSLTKFYGIPGLRLGLCFADREIIQEIRHLQVPWSVNTLAQAVGAQALSDHDFAEESRKRMTASRQDLREKLGAFTHLKVYPGKANFLLCKITDSGMKARELQKHLLGEKIAIRLCDDFIGLDKSFFRIAIRTEEENQLFSTGWKNFYQKVLSVSRIPRLPIP